MSSVWEDFFLYLFVTLNQTYLKKIYLESKIKFNKWLNLIWKLLQLLSRQPQVPAPLSFPKPRSIRDMQVSVNATVQVFYRLYHIILTRTVSLSTTKRELVASLISDWLVQKSSMLPIEDDLDYLLINFKPLK